MSQVIDRRVVLGGETQNRGIIAGNRSRVEWVGLVLTALPLIPVLLGGGVSWQSLTLAVLIAVAAGGLWTPFAGAFFQDRSVAAMLADEFSFRRNRDEFTPRHLATDPGRDVYVAPVAVGHVRVLSADLPSGEELAILRHISPGRRHYYSAAVEMAGPAAGLAKDHEFGEAHQAWGRLCAILARPGSLIRTVQEVTRVVPYDTRDHTEWVMSLLPSTPHEQLTQSYVQLLDMVSAHTEQHRSWLVLRLPVTTEFTLAARRLGEGDEGALRLVAQEVAGVLERATTHGLRVRPLDEKRLSAVIRALQDADYPIDKTAGMSFERAWLPQDARPRRHVIVKGEDGPWYTRTAVIPKTGIEPGRLSPDFLHPLVSNVSPAVVRTISTVIDLVPAHVARPRAKNDVTADRGASREAATRVTDGSEGDQLTVSQQRLDDLRPSTGAHGADWAMSITLCARTEQELTTACRQIEDAAGEAHITALHFLDGEHAAGLITSMPLARGMKVRK